MPLHDVSNSARLRNKQNTSQADPQNSLTNSPFKQQLPKSSPSKNFLSKEVKEMTKLKILLSDKEFQLKKLEEDCSVKLAMMQKQLTRQKNQKKQLIKEFKEKIEEDKQYFQVRIEGSEQTWKEKIVEVEKRVRREMEISFDLKVQEIKCEHQTIVSQLTKKMQKLSSQFDAQHESLISCHKQQLQKNSNNFTQQLQQLSQKSSQQIIQVKQQHLKQTQFYHQMQQQKAKQNNTVVKILSQKIKKMQQEIRVNKEAMQELKREVQFKEQELLVQKRAKEEYRLDKVYLERKLARLEPDVKGESEKQLTQAKLQYQSLLQEHTKKFTQQLSHLRSLHDQSNTNYQHQLEQMQQRCIQVTLLHETLKSNQDDLRKIETLEMKLIKKEMELQKQKEDVKMCKLQLNNMDQIFHKMFQEAKLKSLKPKRNRLPSLLSVGQNRSTMDVYGNANEGATKDVTTTTKEKKKFSIREVNYQSVHNKAKEIRELQSQFAPYQ